MQSLSEDLRSFFALKVDSVELLHVLMLLQDRPDEEWTARKISDELRSSETSVTKRIGALVAREVFAPGARNGDVIRYLPIDAKMAEVLVEAIAFYRQHPYRVEEFIFSKRTQTIRSIADAFRFRKGEN